MHVRNTGIGLFAAVGLVSAIAITTATAAPAYAQEVRRQFDIRAQPLPSALIEFSQQSDVVVTAPSRLTRGKMAPAVRGSYSNKHALELLLEGTGLRAKRAQNGSWVVTAETSTLGGSLRETQLERDSANLSPKPPVDDQEIIVTGTNIRGVEHQASPVYRYTREDIDRTGAQDMAALLRTIPQNFSGGDLGATPDGLFGSGIFKNFNDSGAVTPNLRGLGTGSTLTLVNGRRLAPTAQGSVPDIGIIPTAAIDRVEIMADGASAVYGADGVAGVVNIILRDDYDGFEATVGMVTDDKHDYAQHILGATAGGSWQSGSAMMLASFRDTDGLLASKRPFSNTLPERVTLYPDQTDYSLYATLRQNLGRRVEVSGDLFYANKSRSQTTYRPAGFTDHFADVDQLSIAGTAEIDVGGGWRLRSDVAYSTADENVDSKASDLLGNIQTSESERKSEIFALTAKADGPVLGLPAGDIMVAVGADYRSESYERSSFSVERGVLSKFSNNRNVSSLFGEVLVPVVRNGDNSLLHRLVISAAARLDEYSDYGTATNFKLGGRWDPLSGLTLRTTYSTSFRAPELRQSPVLLLQSLPGFFTAPAGNGTASVILVDGTSPLRPEKARAFTLGFDVNPRALPGLSIDATWFKYKYRDRISAPPFDVNALRLDEYASIVTPISGERDVTDYIDSVLQSGGFAFVDAPFTQYQYFVNFSVQNIAIQRVHGIDVNARYEWTSDDVRISPSLSAVVVLKDDRQFTPESSRFDVKGTTGEQPKTRLRASVTVSPPRWSFTLSANYVSSFVNRSVADSDLVNDWITADFSVQSRFNIGPLASRLSLALINVFDRNPPFVERNFPPFYDPANANPLGRHASLKLTTEF